MGKSNEETDSERYSDEEAAKRRDAALLRALSTPHKKQVDMKIGKSTTPQEVEDKHGRRKDTRV